MARLWLGVAGGGIWGLWSSFVPRGDGLSAATGEHAPSQPRRVGGTPTLPCHPLKMPSAVNSHPTYPYLSLFLSRFLASPAGPCRISALVSARVFSPC